MRYIEYLLAWTNTLTIPDLNLFTTIPAWLSILISIMALRKNLTWKEKFKEHAMNEAYVKTREISQTFKTIENNLFFLSNSCIGGLDLSHLFDRHKDYNEDDLMKRHVRGAMDNSNRTMTALFDSRLQLSALRQGFESLGYVTSAKNKQRIDEIGEHIMEIEAALDSYIKSAYDYFDDKERSQVIRFSKHSLAPVEENDITLTKTMNDNRENIYSRASKAIALLQEIKYKSEISKLYTNK